MAYNNVNTGTAVLGSSGAALTVNCTSATAGNLLVMPAIGGGNTTAPAAPANWTRQSPKAGNSGCSACVMWKIATGGETSAVLALNAGTTWGAQILEFSGNASGTPTDQNGTGNGSITPTLATFGGTDSQSGELIISAGVVKYSANATESLVTTLATVGTTHEATNNASGAVSVHYDFAWGITTANIAADTSSMAFGVVNITGSALSAWSFKLAALTTATHNRTLLHVGA